MNVGPTEILLAFGLLASGSVSLMMLLLPYAAHKAHRR